MKRNIYILLLLLLFPFSQVKAQFVSATLDAASNGTDAVNSNERVSAKLTMQELNDVLNQISDKIDAVMDTVNNVMNMVSDYVSTAREIEEAAEDVAEVMSLYKTFVADISDQQVLTPSVRLRYVNQIIDEVQSMRKTFNELLSVSGKKGLSEAVTGRMTDGQRMKLIRKYAAYISSTCNNIKNIYANVTGHAASVRSARKSYVSSMAAVAGF
jgi:ElaB/YqjD/DUF883 family membrane-anchored ribosome-binding protein